VAFRRNLLANDYCLVCLPGCATCSEGTSCDTCKISLPKRDILNSCACPPGYIEDESGQCIILDNVLVIVCDPICSKCTDSNSCDSCVDGYYFQ